MKGPLVTPFIPHAHNSIPQWPLYILIEPFNCHINLKFYRLVRQPAKKPQSPEDPSIETGAWQVGGNNKFNLKFTEVENLGYKTWLLVYRKHLRYSINFYSPMGGYFLKFLFKYVYVECLYLLARDKLALEKQLIEVRTWEQRWPEGGRQTKKENSFMDSRSVVGFQFFSL